MPGFFVGSLLVADYSPAARISFMAHLCIESKIRHTMSPTTFGKVAAIFAVTLSPVPGYAEIFYGFANTTLEVNQEEMSGGPNFTVLKTWMLPVTVQFRVATDFATSDLLGIDLNFHDTIYEDMSHNFEFSFSIRGEIFGPGPVDIDIIPGRDDWLSEFYWDALDANLTLHRRVFSTTSDYENHVFDDTVWFARDQLNFNDYPGSITYVRDSGAWPLGSVPYSDTGRLRFLLYRQPDLVSVSPAICSHSGCGDYNRNGTVDAADYVLWRDSLGQSGMSLAADGNSNGTVEAADYYVWRMYFGQETMGTVSANTIPEPSTILLTVAVALAIGGSRWPIPVA